MFLKVLTLEKDAILLFVLMSQRQNANFLLFDELFVVTSEATILSPR